METKVKISGFEDTEENNQALRKVVSYICPRTTDLQSIEVGKEFSVLQDSSKTREEITADLERLMRAYLEHPF